jgi:hypothetical protein
MVLSLARALDVPLRERNQMLLAAATRRSTARRGSTTRMAQVGGVAPVLAHHEPYPAVVMDRHWNVQQANDAARAMFAFLLDDDGRADEPANVVRLMLRLRRVANWEQTGEALVQRVHREAVGVPDPQTTRARRGPRA